MIMSIKQVNFQPLPLGLAGLPSDVAQHPVHVVGPRGARQPSAFIPFCSLATKLSLLGQKATDLAFPVCSGFKPTVMQVPPVYNLPPSNSSIMFRASVATPWMCPPWLKSHTQEWTPFPRRPA